MILAIVKPEFPKIPHKFCFLDFIDFNVPEVIHGFNLKFESLSIISTSLPR